MGWNEETRSPALPVRPFIDTNVLLYAIAEGDARADVAWGLLNKGGVSAQVLNEFVSIARRKFQKPWLEIEEKIGDFRAVCDAVRPLTVQTHESGLRIAARYGYHVDDALILASAVEGGCDVVYSDDMQDGQRVEGVTIRNPFQ
jgi:predicted nucleic acid-binding protein